MDSMCTNQGDARLQPQCSILACPGMIDGLIGVGGSNHMHVHLRELTG